MGHVCFRRSVGALCTKQQRASLWEKKTMETLRNPQKMWWECHEGMRRCFKSVHPIAPEKWWSVRLLSLRDGNFPGWVYLSLFPFRETSLFFCRPKKSSPFPREDEALRKKHRSKQNCVSPLSSKRRFPICLVKPDISSAPKPRGKSDPFVVYTVSSVGCGLCSLGTLSDDDNRTTLLELVWGSLVQGYFLEKTISLWVDLLLNASRGLLFLIVLDF